MVYFYFGGDDQRWSSFTSALTKTERLREIYRQIEARLNKQKVTLRRMGKGRTAKRFRARKQDTFGSAGELRKGIDAKKVSRWRLSGKMLLLNVAQGSFPGRHYYGSQLAQRLDARLKQLGLQDIGNTVKNRGGGRLKAERTGVKVRRSKRSSEALSLQAYGKSKLANPVGGGLE